MITLNNLSLDFAGNIIFKNISLQIKKTDKIGLIGNNGSGKTTLLNLLSKKTDPTSGQVSLYGQPLKRFLPREMLRQGVGRIPEDRHGFGVVGDLNLA